MIIKNLGRTDPKKKTNYYYLCSCDTCNNEFKRRKDSPQFDLCKPCTMKAVGVKNRTIKYDNKTEYGSWSMMRQRCNNKKSTRYERYGGRGITVSTEWNNSFEKFLFDMGKKPTIDHQIDRIDTNSNYCKENCIWSTRQDNQINTSKSKRWFLFGNKYDSLSIAAKEIGVSDHSIRAWCDGRTSEGRYYPPKDGCYSELLY
jgi:hypothetical protein